MSDQIGPNPTLLRPAGYNERRYITRQSLGYYRTLAIGGIYTYDGPKHNITEQSFVSGLRHCIATHPLLSAAIKGQDSEAPIFVRPQYMDLRNHIEVLDAESLEGRTEGSSEKDLIHRVTSRTLDTEFSNVDVIPPWKLVVLVLPSRTGSQESGQRLFILWAYYHSHGDGKSALAFHNTFLQGLNLDMTSETETKFLCKTPSTPLPPSIEQAGNLSISWSYLLGPLFGAYLPGVVTKFLGLRASTTPKSADAWKGVNIPSDHDTFETGLEFFNISNDTMEAALQLCRQHNTKFTGLLHQLIVRALSELLPDSATAGSFIGLTVVDLRHLLTGVGPDDITTGPSASFELFPRSESKDFTNWTAPDSTHSLWTTARKTTESLARCASTLADQPIGLLSYLSKFRPWMEAEAAKDRESSYEISNLAVFSPVAGSGRGTWDIESMFFAQPANALGSCLAFNVVTKQGGDTVISVTWQKGTLGVQDEQVFVGDLCRLLSAYLGEVA